MNLELFSESKWNILSVITENPQSPLDLSKKFGTTISNISQQLKLLEYSGLVSKKKEKNSGPGKAKTIYFVPNNKMYMISLNSNGAKKKEIKKTDHQLLTSNIWLYSNEEDKYFIEKFFWENEEIIENAEIICLKKQKDGDFLVLEVVPKNGAMIKSLKLNVKNTHDSRNVKLTVLKEMKTPRKDYVILLDKRGVLKTIGGKFE